MAAPTGSSPYGPLKSDRKFEGVTLFVCTKDRGVTSPSCGWRGSPALVGALEAFMSQAQIPVRVEPIACLGYCYKGPNVRVKGGAFFHEVSEQDFPAILEAVHTKAGLSSSAPAAEGV
ncbi:MAG: (2Fe-2S) ferredoxin domain-containing protein [Rhodospirillaceae bacterium]